MNDYAIYALGFFAQSLFGSRLVIQWFLSERQGKVVSPTVFWVLSLLASFLFLIYGVLRNDPVILLGQAISYYIYIRNLQLKGFWRKIPVVLRAIIFPLPVILFTWILYYTPASLQRIATKFDFTDVMIVIGSIGQLLLNFRYFYQWYYSERARQSVLPLGFWLISLVASVMVVSYAVTRFDPVLLVAQGLGMMAYARNIYLSLKTAQHEAA